VVSVPKRPPEILELDPYPLLFHARDYAGDEIIDNETNRLKGWQRICLFSLYFRPNTLETVPFIQAFREAKTAPERSLKGYFGLFPFRWKSGWKKSFQSLLHQQKRLLVAPILQTLILNRAPIETLIWAEWVANWQFEQIVACHFDSPVVAKPDQFREAFSFLQKRLSGDKLGKNSTSYLPEEDLELLKEIDKNLTKLRIVPPSVEQV